MPIVWGEELTEKQSFVKTAHVEELRGHADDAYDHGNSIKGHDTYVQDITVAANPWVIEHNLGTYPVVTTFDDTGEEVRGDVHYDSENQISITFDAELTGTVYLN